MLRQLSIFFVIALISSMACTDSPTVSATVEVGLYLQVSQADYDSVYIVIDSVFLVSADDSAERTLVNIGPDTVIASEYRNGRNYPLSLVKTSTAAFWFD